MKRAVVVISDGLRADMVTPELTPNLCGLSAEGAFFPRHRGVYPSTTRTTSAAIATGCLPGRNGLEGNCVAIDDGAGLKAYNVGKPDFRDRLRNATGQTLRVPTLAERLKNDGGCIVFSNVSAGAAYFQDPDGHGHVYHRQGSFGPGLQPLPASESLDVSHDADGDAVMAERFIAEVLGERRPRLALLWQCEPDHTQHAKPLGSPGHLAVLAKADATAGSIARAVLKANDADDVLLILASDHGHETVAGVVPLEQMLIEAGLKDAEGSADVVVASNAFSAHIYVAADARSRIEAIGDFLEKSDAVDGIFAGAGLAEVGLATDSALAFSVTPRRSDAANGHGIRGISDAFYDPLSGETRKGCGQHGGLGRFEQNPFLIVIGGGFGRGQRREDASSAIDLAPTILRHLGLPFAGMDGKPLATA